MGRRPVAMGQRPSAMVVQASSPCTTFQQQLQAAADEVLDGLTGLAAAALFLLPGGRPRFFASTIHEGGRPRRRPRPRARRSRLNIASSNCSRSWRNSSRIFETSIRYSCSLFRNGTSLGVLVPYPEQSDAFNNVHRYDVYQTQPAKARFLFRFWNKDCSLSTRTLSDGNGIGVRSDPGNSPPPIKIER